MNARNFYSYIVALFIFSTCTFVLTSCGDDDDDSIVNPLQGNNNGKPQDPTDVIPENGAGYITVYNDDGTVDYKRNISKAYYKISSYDYGEAPTLFMKATFPLEGSYENVTEFLKNQDRICGLQLSKQLLGYKLSVGERFNFGLAYVTDFDYSKGGYNWSEKTIYFYGDAIVTSFNPSSETITVKFTKCTLESGTNGPMFEGEITFVNNNSIM